MREIILPTAFQPEVKLSVIIPVRNESTNIIALLEDLDQQSYPTELFEVIVVDDHSEDETAALVQAFANQASITVRLLQLKHYDKLYLKKAAVQKGVELATGELLVFTDGDCRVQPNWLSLFAHTYQTEQAVFISGPVSFRDTISLFEKMQLVEFASLIGIGGASIALGKPNMCNGANLAYTKAAFQEINGFAGNEGVASGDDEFILHKLSEHYPTKITFLKNAEAIVYTNARKTLSSFISQRVRWASKWRSYTKLNVQLVALTVFMVNLLLFLAISAVIVGWLPLWLFILAYVAKLGVDFLFLSRILAFLGKQKYKLYILPLQLVYIPYVLVTALAGLFGRYTWKGRTLKTL